MRIGSKSLMLMSHSMDMAAVFVQVLQAKWRVTDLV